MGIKSLKIGSSVTVKDTGHKSSIKSIENGCYKIASSDLCFSAGDLIIEKMAPAKKKPQRVNAVADKTACLKEIYRILSGEFLRNHKTCRARFAGCTEKATEVHHMYKRTGFWLIVQRLFFPICTNCHRTATDHSAEAIKSGVSISRLKQLPYNFSPRELNFMKEYGINPPE